MDMFTVKQTDSSWLACCRACGHEQALPHSPEDTHTVNVMSVKCERCPSEESELSLPEANIAAAGSAGTLGQSPVIG